MFQDITTTDNEITFVIDKISSSLHLVKLDVVPQIVHLLLISATKVIALLLCFSPIMCYFHKFKCNLARICQFGLFSILDKLLCTS